MQFSDANMALGPQGERQRSCYSSHRDSIFGYLQLLTSLRIVQFCRSRTNSSSSGRHFEPYVEAEASALHKAWSQINVKNLIKKVVLIASYHASIGGESSKSCGRHSQEEAIPHKSQREDPGTKRFGADSNGSQELSRRFLVGTAAIELLLLFCECVPKEFRDALTDDDPDKLAIELSMYKHLLLTTMEPMATAIRWRNSREQGWLGIKTVVSPDRKEKGEYSLPFKQASTFMTMAKRLIMAVSSGKDEGLGNTTRPLLLRALISWIQMTDTVPMPRPRDRDTRAGADQPSMSLEDGRAYNLLFMQDPAARISVLGMTERLVCMTMAAAPPEAFIGRRYDTRHDISDDRTGTSSRAKGSTGILQCGKTRVSDRFFVGWDPLAPSDGHVIVRLLPRELVWHLTRRLRFLSRRGGAGLDCVGGVHQRRDGSRRRSRRQSNVSGSRPSGRSLKREREVLSTIRLLKVLLYFHLVYVCGRARPTDMSMIDTTVNASTTVDPKSNSSNDRRRSEETLITDPGVADHEAGCRAKILVSTLAFMRAGGLFRYKTGGADGVRINLAAVKNAGIAPRPETNEVSRSKDGGTVCASENANDEKVEFISSIGHVGDEVLSTGRLHIERHAGRMYAIQQRSLEGEYGSKRSLFAAERSDTETTMEEGGAISASWLLTTILDFCLFAPSFSHRLCITRRARVEAFALLHFFARDARYLPSLLRHLATLVLPPSSPPISPQLSTGPRATDQRQMGSCVMKDQDGHGFQDDTGSDMESVGKNELDEKLLVDSSASESDSQSDSDCESDNDSTGTYGLPVDGCLSFGRDWNEDAHDQQKSSPDRAVGLVNQGLTCYCNSLLQQFFMIPEVRRGILRGALPPRGSHFEKHSMDIKQQIHFKKSSPSYQDHIASSTTHSLRDCKVQPWIVPWGSGIDERYAAQLLPLLREMQRTFAYLLCSDKKAYDPLYASLPFPHPPLVLSLVHALLRSSSCSLSARRISFSFYSSSLMILFCALTLVSILSGPL